MHRLFQAVAVSLCLAAIAFGQTESPPPLQLAQLEAMALRNHPTLAQAEAAIRAAEGQRLQAGLWPNPTLGYEADGLAFNSRVRPNRRAQGFFVEQEIVLGGKLAKSQNIYAQAKNEAAAQAEAQRWRVTNAVRMLFYETLGAQQLADLRKQLVELTRSAVTISEDLFNVGQADRPDVLAAEVELQRADIELLRAENNLARAWQTLATVVNEPSMFSSKAQRLAGSLEDTAPALKQDEMLATLLRESPELKAAQANLARAQAMLARAQAEPIPDAFVRGGVSNSREFEDVIGRRVGNEARFELGLRIPLFNRNQGNIASAQAELTSAERELQRVELSLRARWATSYTQYLNALGIAARYHRDILPRAQRAYDLYLAKFSQMAAAYPQVIITQRTLFEARTEYIASLVELWQSVTQLRGFLLQ
jgi:outer membrane protein, heavy metal efflux system